jgi:methylthioribulose-1-phosphate dehydratase
MLSDIYGASGGLYLEGYEMLKGLRGVATHEHRLWIPILENDQDMARLSAKLAAVLDEHPEARGVLLRRHGLYTWGESVLEAERHVEIFEFLFETVGRTATFATREMTHGAAAHS